MNSLVRHHHNLVEEAGTHARAEVVSVLPKTVLRMQTDTLPASGWSDRFLRSEVREKLQVAEFILFGDPRSDSNLPMATAALLWRFAWARTRPGYERLLSST